MYKYSLSLIIINVKKCKLIGLPVFSDDISNLNYFGRVLKKISVGFCLFIRIG